ncbi:Pyridoxal phosphate phosphatase YbhA [Aquisphaera giovannonii]|uniref:Pyridoxal phosphate phosphatase YbhA n=1 Tax=Aquisphaera giovannonii TaxID=406548 RepID=A0A5B9VX31_9BACT|nr:HAD family hydrolase [Aquisphaera giovannonii]QEH32828.1 Pyridoxal phosphate phosphatase YbhA [Aquisphaera giovannonii]
MTTRGRGKYRILALDVDGTLLDADGRLRPTTAEAVARASAAGIRPVLCTGRRYRRAREIADALGLDTPIVCNSGAVVKDPRDHATLWRADMDGPLVEAVIGLFREHGLDTVAFTDRRPDRADFVIPRYPTGLPHFDEYVARNHAHAEVDAAWRSGAGEPEPVFHLCAVGTRAEMSRLERAVHARVPEQVQTFVQRSPRYVGTMCEVLRRDANKWTAVLHLANLWGVDRLEICAVGDDVNDVPMIRHAGLGVAMGHAPEAVRAAAAFVTGDHHQDGVAMLVNDVLLAS